MIKDHTSPVKKNSAAIRWPEVHRRLEAAQAAVEQGGAQNAEDKKKILKARAKMLAQEPQPTEGSTRYLKVVEFLLSYERYGIESSYIREVYPLKDLTALPGVPAFLLGIVSVRGRLLSVIDVKKFFELPEKGLTDLNKVIIVHKDALELGILADAIVGVRSIPVREVQPSLFTLTDIRAEYLKGVTQERLVILDVEKILTDKGITLCAEAEKTLPGSALPG